MRIARSIVLSVALAFVPCAAHAQGKSAPKDAVLYFVWPQDGTLIKGGFWCRFGLRNMGITHAGDDFHNSGHHHLLIDVNEPLDPNEPIPQDKSHLHLERVKPRHGSSCRPASTLSNWCWAMPSTIRSSRRSSRTRLRSGSGRTFADMAK